MDKAPGEEMDNQDEVKASYPENMLCIRILQGAYLVAAKRCLMLLFPGRGGEVGVLRKLPVKAGEAGIAHLSGDDADRIHVEMDQVAGLTDAAVLKIFERAYAHHRLEKLAEMTFTDAAIPCKRTDGKRFGIMLTDIGQGGADAGAAVFVFRCARRALRDRAEVFEQEG